MIQQKQNNALKPQGNVSSVNGSTNFADGKYYHFYDIKQLGEDDAPKLYQQLLANAKKSIVIWDPYYYLNCENIFCDIKQDGIYVEILTVCKLRENKSDMDTFAEKVRDSIDTTNVPNCKVRVYSYKHNHSSNCVWTEWHDRFLIIDDDLVYLVGSSMDSQVIIKSNNYYNKSFGIMEVTSKEDVNLIKDLYKRYRNAVKEGQFGNGYKSLVQR